MTQMDDVDCVETEIKKPLDILRDESVSVKKMIESIFFASKKPINIKQLMGILPEEKQVSAVELESIIQELMMDYEERSIELVQVSSGYRFQIRSNVVPWISALWAEKASKYGRAFLETLSIIAYKQPVTRGEIEEVRGVNVSSYIMRTLQERDWVRVIGYREVPGKPAMYATTRQFLDYFNLKSLTELPSLSGLSEQTPLTEQSVLDLEDMKDDGLKTFEGKAADPVALVDVELSKNFKDQSDEADHVVFESLDALLDTVKTDFVDYELEAELEEKSKKTALEQKKPDEKELDC